MSLTDRRLADRMLAGDERALDEFFDTYFSGLYRFAMARMDHKADAAEEVVQATLCAGISKLETYRGEATLFTWLCTFCRHEISAYYRRENRQPRSVDLADESLEFEAALESLWSAGSPGPEESVLREEVTQLVHAVLDHLPGRYGDALEWKYLEGLSVDEIAARFGLSPKAAESLLTRAREAFRAAFAAVTRGRFPWSPPRREIP